MIAKTNNLVDTICVFIRIVKLTIFNTFTNNNKQIPSKRVDLIPATYIVL